MKNFYLILIFLLIVAPANAFNDVVLPQSGYGAANNLIINEVITNEDFENLEKIIFKKTYPSDSAQKRLSRLEKEVFGMAVMHKSVGANVAVERDYRLVGEKAALLAKEILVDGKKVKDVKVITEDFKAN